MLSEAENKCRVCGLDQGELIWGTDGHSPTHDICPCCGVEFGYEDCTTDGIAEHRKQWLASGAEWSSKKERPSNWNLGAQLKLIPPKFL